MSRTRRTRASTSRWIVSTVRSWPATRTAARSSPATGKTTNERVTLATVVDHIDHVCQVAGNAHHAAIGTDLDGGYGTEQTPNDLDTIADVQKIAGLLRDRGYGEGDITGIMHGNWLRLLERALPA